MRGLSGFADVKASGENRQLPPGAYIAMVTAVEDVPDKEYLKVSFDIAVGEYAHYFGEMQERLGWNNGNMFRSYKEKALPMFKAFLAAVDASNDTHFVEEAEKGFDEQKLRAKVFGIVLAEEEYTKNDGSVGTRLYTASVRSVETIEKGGIKIPEKKLINKAEAAPADLIPTDLPF